MVIGVVLVLLGLIGFVNNPVFGIFGVNVLQDLLHLVVGGLGIWLAMKGSAMSFNKWLGIGAAVVGVLGFVPGINTLLTTIFGINPAISVLHILVAIVSLGVVYGLKK